MSKRNHRCYWCTDNIVLHHVGRDVQIWVHQTSNVIWCNPDLLRSSFFNPGTTAWPRRSRRSASEVNAQLEVA